MFSLLEKAAGNSYDHEFEQPGDGTKDDHRSKNGGSAIKSGSVAESTASAHMRAQLEYFRLYYSHRLTYSFSIIIE